MINVKNKKTVKRVADTSFKKEKMRNVFAVIAITLTTVLFCSLFAVSSSLLASIEESTMRQSGGNAHAGFKFLTEEEYENISKHPDIKEISYSVVLGVAENEELIKRTTEIRYTKDELFAQMFFAMPTTGRLPEAKDEIATDTLVLEKLGIPARLGEIVTLQYSVCGKQYVDTFTLVGFWDGDIIMPASQAWLSKEYVEGILSEYDATTLGEMIGSINADINFNNSWNIEAKLEKVIIESGYSPNELNSGVNWAYMGGNEIEAGTVLGMIAVLFVIVFCGYLMISNVFMISVAKDVRFYGLLKTIGTTGKQIKNIIRRQALRISLVGIPIGLLVGSLVGSVLTPVVLGITNITMVKISIRWWVFVFAALFALVTVFISIQKAEKIAAQISPIEALRMTDATGNRKRKSKSGQRILLWKMAAENVGRNRKRVCLVTVSLSLSLVILNGAYSMSNSLNMDAYLSGLINHDFVMGDVTWFNVGVNYRDADTMNDDFLDELSGYQGIESLEKIYFSEKLCPLDEHWDGMAERVETELEADADYIEHLKDQLYCGNLVYHVYGIDDAVWDDVTVWQGEIDLEKLRSGNYVVVSPYDEEGKLNVYEVGDKVDVFTKNGESRNCEVIAIASIPYGISIQHSHPAEVNIFMPSEVFLQYVEDKCPMVVTLDVEDGEIDTMEHFLEEYCEKRNQNMQYTSKATYIAEYEDTQRTYKMVGIVISVLLAMIGIANFANTSITSIVARKHEFAVLESIGMTLKQQRRMLVLEGLIYMLLTSVVTCTIGAVIGYYGISLLLSGSNYYTITFTIMPSMLCMPILLMLTIIIPLLSQKYVNCESVVERLRRTE